MKQYQGRVCRNQRSKLKILLVDDRTIDRELIRLRLERCSEFQVVGEAEDGKRALARVSELEPDLVIVDFDMPAMNGLQTVRELRTRYPEVKTVGFSMYNDGEIAAEMLRAGASAFVSKEKGVNALVRVVKNLLC